MEGRSSNQYEEGVKEIEKFYHPTTGMSWHPQATSAITTEEEGGPVGLAAAASKSNT